MNQRLVVGCLAIGLAAGTTASAQSLKQAGEIRAKSTGKPEAKSVVFESNSDRILKAVNPAQPEAADRLRNLLREWDATYTSNGIGVAKGKVNNDPGLLEKREWVEKELKEASAAGDAAKAEKAASDLAHLDELIGGFSPHQEETRRAIDSKLQSVAEEFLSTDELKRLVITVDQVWVEAGGHIRERTAPDRSPMALKKIVERLQDLTADQRAGIEGLFRNHQMAERAAPAKEDAAAKKARDGKLYDDVFAILTDGQKDIVERELRGRDAAANNAGADAGKPGDEAKGKAPAASDGKAPGAPTGDAGKVDPKAAEPKK